LKKNFIKILFILTFEVFDADTSLNNFLQLSKASNTFKKSVFVGGSYSNFNQEVSCKLS
jgi:hypothetical protein